MGRRRQRVRRLHGQPLVLRRRSRAGRDRRRRRRPAAHAGRLLVLRPVHERAGRRAGRAASSGLSPLDDPRVFFCGSGSEAVDTVDEARPAGPRAGRSPGADAHHQPGARLPRHQPRRHQRAGHRAEPGRLGAAGPRGRPGAERRRRGPGRADGRAGRRGRRRHHRAGAGRRGRLPARPRLPAELRRLCDHHGALPRVRRGDHRVRPPRPLVRRRPLRRRARSHDVRQGRHVGLPASRRRDRRTGRCATRWSPTRPSCSATATRTPATPPPARPGWPTSSVMEREALPAAAAAIGSALGDGPAGARRRRRRSPRPAATARCGRPGCGPTRTPWPCATGCSPAA